MESDIGNSLKDRIRDFLRTLIVAPKAVLFIVIGLFTIIFICMMASCTVLAMTGAGSSGTVLQTRRTSSLTAAEYTISFFLKDKGFGDTQIAAIMGNLKQEKSDFDPASDTGSVLGIMQWTGPERTRLINWCTEHGYGDSIYTLETQLTYACEAYIPASWHFPKYSGEHAYPKSYDITYEEWLKLEPEDIDLATAAFCACCEKPYYRDTGGNQSELHEHRIPYARNYLMSIKSGALAGSSYVSWAINVANDPAHGYDQKHRDGPDYDCSSLVAYALRAAGYDVAIFDTKSEIAELEKAGFVRLPYDPSRLMPGDILWVEGHTEIYVGNSETVGAHLNEAGGTKGGITGDQTGSEICVRPVNRTFTYIFRLPEITENTKKALLGEEIA